MVSVHAGKLGVVVVVVVARISALLLPSAAANVGSILGGVVRCFAEAETSFLLLRCGLAVHSTTAGAQPKRSTGDSGQRIFYTWSGRATFDDVNL